MTSLSPFNRRELRAGLIQMVAERGFTHAITLNGNREASFTAAHAVRHQRMLFGKFCYGVDLVATGKKRVHRLPSANRFDAIAFPEHLNSNSHMHLAANFSEHFWGRPFDESHYRRLEHIWVRVTNGPGTLKIVPVRDNGWAWYITKEMAKPDYDYFLSRDFHR